MARRAGVSVATVSRVQRRSAPVRERTRRRVEDAIAELRYTPSRLGRSLAERRHAALGIVFPDLSGPYFSEVIHGFELAAADAEHGVLILSTHGREAAAERVGDLATRVDGLLVLGRTVPDSVIERLRATGVPVVLLARPSVAGADSVRAENSTAAEQLAGHLIARHGHRRIAFLGDPDGSPDGAERWAGFVAAHRAVGSEPYAGPIRSSYREREGFAAAHAALQDPEPPTALFCANDEIALGAYAAAQERGLRIGRRLAITGWDDIALARHVSPPLTTVEQPMRELGMRGARVLERRIRERKSGVPPGAPVEEVLGTRLVIRASCGCRRSQGGTAQ
ncbi:MAG TPA: LacI family DNA-binding transcriptional regulator [Candidatus Limnocylindria bacterium]|nr:LacI family DNA-binding transcriptional regulator [Candidatus Limnocylindria bacterium]